MSLGQGLGKVAGKVFRIGHLGDFNDLMLCGTLAGVEMGLALAGVPHRKGGVAGGDGAISRDAARHARAARSVAHDPATPRRTERDRRRHDIHLEETP